MTGGLFEPGAYLSRGLIRTGGLFQNLGLYGGLFEYGGLIGTGGLNEDLRYISFFRQYGDVNYDITWHVTLLDLSSIFSDVSTYLTEVSTLCFHT